ncbi:MAG TPA: C10 family peptidase, partial [Bacteroidales bacterium]|nr:C10 family peptidase [Bacteroidales bacterium]
MKKTLILIFIFTFSLSAFAGFVPLKNAEKVAKSHVYQTIASFEPLEWKDINLNCLFDPSQNDIYKFYVFNINGDQGYVIVSSDDQIIPILAYSFEGGFNFNNMSPGQAEFLNYFNKSIEYANNNEMPVNKKAVSQWQELLDFNQTKSFQLKATSPILLGEINWNQIWPYNSQCPTDPNSGGGLNGHVPVGCSAIALLQVMKYYNWPSTGTGSKTHLNDANGGYGDITINFAQQTYDWFSIPDQASDFENPELGKICFHAGVAVSMEWGPSGSGAFIHDVAEALKNHFKYNPSLSHVQKYSYSETDWKNLIKQQIDSKKPMIYAGYSTSLGHAWNCDGYQDDSFHMNWGWGGAGDGYYTLDNLTSSATPEGEEYNFILYNEMIINIYPDTGYPEYCQSEKLITGSEGSFDDGSGPEDYETNLSCVYEIIPNCESIVNLIFTNLDLGDGDVVELYDGDKNSTKLIATFDKYNPPTTDAYTSITGGMTIKFNTDASSQADGWKVQYAVESCKQNMIFTETQGNLSDGSKSCDYKNSTSCSWIIEPEGATHINLDFVSCEIADNTDYLKIYKNTINTSNLLYHFNKSTIPNGTITIPSGRAVLEFYTNSSGVDEGWELNYTSSASTVPPIANFIGNPTTIETEQYVNFTDLSTNCLAAWDWTFEGGTPPTSNEQNPTVYYMNAGTYNVSLTVSNGSQNFTETKNGYITVLPPSSGFTYDFEACPNFVVDQFSPCTTYDGDGSYTYGISGINFENAYYKGSFIAFNHSATEPASPSALSAHGGSKYGACFAAVNGPNNDWFITPKINLESNSSFSFWARSLTSQNGLERFNVLISTTDNNPSSFTKISTGTYTEASTTWTKYTYDLNAYNGQGVHCAIQCVSDVAFVFMIDDIEIATTPTNVDFTWTGDQCSENTLAFASGSAPAGSNYVWKVNGSIVNEGSPIFSHTFPTVSTATDFQVSLYVTSGSLTKDTTKTITIYPLPTVAISTANQDVCQGQPATLTASGATNYEWSTTETGNEINVTVNESTTFYVTGTDINSCTNTASINMTAIPITTTVVYNDLCEGDTYNFYGTNLTEQGTHYHTLTSLNTGCDSIIQLELTVNPTFLEETVDVICDSELPYTWQGEEYNETGEYEKIHQTVLGCDSVYTLYLTVNPTFLEETVDVICDSELPYTWQGEEYNETGEYEKIHQTVLGCDSVYTLYLTVNPTFLEETVDVICDS